MSSPAEPPAGGQEPEPRPDVPLISIQQFESPDDAVEAHPMADQRSTDQRAAPQRPTEQSHTDRSPAEQRPAEQRPAGQRSPEQAGAQSPAPGPGRRGKARGAARVRPPAPHGPDAPRLAKTDIQTTSGVPATPIPSDAGAADTQTQLHLPSGSAPSGSAPSGSAPGGSAPGAEAGGGPAEDTASPHGHGDPSAATQVILLPPGGAATAPAGAGQPADLQRTAANDETVVIAAPTAEPLTVPAVPAPVVPGTAGTGRATDPGTATTGGERRGKPRGGQYDLGHAPAVLLLSSLGVLLVAGAYAGGRAGASGSLVAYWIGQVVVFTPVVTRLLSRRMAGIAESFTLVMGLAVNQYLLKWMYSPDQFRFPDELQHWLATTIVTQTGALFQPNLALPPAVHFPGLAEMGAATASMTGLPVTASGIIVAGVAHLVFVGVLFVAVLRASNSPAVAGVACATYATALHYLFFNSMFLYQTAALPFFMLAIWATRRWREGGGWAFVFVAVASVVGTTVSHHVTAFALVATMVLLGVTELVQERPRRWSALIMPAVTLVIVAGWILLVAQDVIGYLAAPIQQIGETFSQLVTGGAAGSVTPAIAFGQLALQATGLLGLFVLYLAVGRDMVLRRDRDTWRWAALVGGGIFFAGNAVRFLGANGPEAAGRLATFTYVPISIIAAIALVRAVQIIPARDAEGRRWWVQPALEVPPPKGRHLVVRVAAGSALVTLLMIGARAGGWPPIGSLLPGPYLAGGFERSVDAYGVDAATWERTVVGPHHRTGGDVTSVSLASTYGRQDPVREVGALYYAEQWDLDDDQLVANLRLQYLVVDRRLTTQLPVSQAYFEADPMAGRITKPLSAKQIGKFDAIPDVDRLYDNGTVRIYRMGGE